MEHFLETTETIIEGVGFTHYDFLHTLWLILFATATIANIIYYRNATPEKRSQWRNAGFDISLSQQGMYAGFKMRYLDKAQPKTEKNSGTNENDNCQ